MSAGEGTSRSVCSTTNPSSSYEPEDLSTSTFFKNRVTDLIEYYVKDIMTLEHKKIVNDWDKYKFKKQTKFETKYGNKMDKLEKGILNAKEKAIGKDCREYAGIAIILTLVESPESDKNYVDNLAKVVDDVINVEKIPNALCLELKVRNILGAVYYSRTKNSNRYNSKANENFNKVRVLCNKMRCLSDSERSSIQTWMNWNQPTFLDELIDADLQKIRNFYTYYMDRNLYDSSKATISAELLETYKKDDNARAREYGLLYIEKTLREEYKFKSYGVGPRTYFVFICVCYTLAMNCISVGSYYQAENCLAVADSAFRLADSKIFWTISMQSESRRSHKYVKALVNIGYGKLLLSWALQWAEGRTLNSNLKVLGIIGVNRIDNHFIYRNVCVRKDDLRQNVKEACDRSTVAKKQIPAHALPIKEYGDLFREVMKYYDPKY